MTTENKQKLAGLVLAACAAGIALYVWSFLHAESQWAVGVLVLVGLGALVVARRTGFASTARDAARKRPGFTRASAVCGALILILAFYDTPFVLLMLCALMLYSTACLGLTIQVGFAGVANFAGAAFFGIGSYATAVLAAHTSVPHLLIIVLSGGVAALVGSVLITPVLRTRGHYAALVTIAFGILFKTFLEVNDLLGGPQGLQVPGLRLFDHEVNDGFSINGIDFSFYVAYAILSLLVLVLAHSLVSALERSWIGLSMDVLRTDETAAATFGLHIARWKVIAFTLGNFLAGVAGSLYGMVSSFVAPNNFTFADSLLMLSIVILGGQGNIVGLLPAVFIILIIPEKLQFIQEYRFLLFSVLIIAILLFRPQGLLPRPTRRFFNREGL